MDTRRRGGHLIYSLGMYSKPKSSIELGQPNGRKKPIKAEIMTLECKSVSVGDLENKLLFLAARPVPRKPQPCAYPY